MANKNNNNSSGRKPIHKSTDHPSARMPRRGSQNSADIPSARTPRSGSKPKK